MKVYIVILKDIGGRTDQRFYYTTKEKAERKKKRLESKLKYIKPDIKIGEMIVR